VTAGVVIARLRAWRLPLPADSGFVGCIVIGLLLLTFALTIDFPKAAYGFQSDEATYYSLAHSLAEDGDFAYQRQDLTRVWEEFPTGPEGIFLKRGRTISFRGSSSFPFVKLVQTPDPQADRLYFAKGYMYPLAAAPFVFLFGTNGFLVLHALLVTLALAAAYAFLRARSPAPAAFAYAVVFFFASAAPVYFVWLTPELFNLTVALLGLFLWCYKEVAPPLTARSSAFGAPITADDDAAPSAFLRGNPAYADSRWSRWLRSPASTYAGAVLLGIVTFSKPTNIFIIAPALLLLLFRKQWGRLIATGLVFGVVVSGLFALNFAITGDVNYQGGDRNTFYGGSPGGFPFQTNESIFKSDATRATNAVPTEVLLNRDVLLSVFPHNLIYYTFGRHTGIAAYFFPGVLSLLLFLFARSRRSAFQWLAAGAFAASSLLLILYMPFTYSGGGGPVGNRYFLGFYPLLLFVTPALASLRPAITAMAIGGLFTAQLVLNPFYVSFHPGEHMKTGAYRWLPVELSLVNDLPMNVTPAKVRQPLGGTPPVAAYFLDDNAYSREGEWFWVRGESTAELVLRAPIRQRADGTYESLRIHHLNVEIRSGDVINDVVVKSATHRSHVDLAPNSEATLTVRLGEGLPYKPVPGLPTNYVYFVSIRSRSGFMPLFTSGSRDNRFLGAMIHIVPSYE
jgi:hypothetical protein